jgi:hypothetical protein
LVPCPRRLWFRIVKPRRPILPAGRELKVIVGLAHRVEALKNPGVLQDKRIFLDLIIVTDDVAWLGRGYMKDPAFFVGHQFVAWYRPPGLILCGLVVYLVVSPLRGNTPGMEVRDLLIGFKKDAQSTQVASFWAQNLICLANSSLDLVR